MSAAIVAKKRKTNRLSEDKVEFRAEPAFIIRLDAAAAKEGLTRSAFIRQLLSRELDRRDKADSQEG